MKGLLAVGIFFVFVGAWLSAPMLVEATQGWEHYSLSEYNGDCSGRGTAIYSVCYDSDCKVNCNLDYFYVSWSGCSIGYVKKCDDADCDCDESGCGCGEIGGGSTSFTCSSYDLLCAETPPSADGQFSVGICINDTSEQPFCRGWHSRYVVTCGWCDCEDCDEK